ncbi:MAG: BrnT family toxin [Desulfomonilia bacterium]|jgi:uncharacterized DUF497 family protein|uniref:Toxin n=1 Tax=anaerobic digester metagenome TaxID=1263854 RepID=A0A485M313_9ZZZZ|nr:BrnT family toxin [Pseudomonadota bacterium]HON38192.1 BrnT family toxin [Deltaproteobacteria bacterium]HRS56459.1 BrnT family toxin [Desulfomonilia bacterium]HPD22715.1 BrnT family toxin [Deltaproteobacteria bacterium]HPW69503.1 BrnT family toxin [Deltaproteobacteria bacterium]
MKEKGRAGYSWDEKKNSWLKENRGISFEDIVAAIDRGCLLDVIENPAQERYRGQFMYVVAIDNYVYLVPFELRSEIIRLITIIPNRKATKKYLKENE